MKILLCVFSGTGNTLRVAGLYKKYSDAEVKIYNVRNDSGPLPDLGEYDLIGFGYPIHAFNAPEPIIKFAKSLPMVQNKPAFVFKSSGEGWHINDCSSQKLIKILKKRGFDVMFERHIVMPYNMIYRHNDSMAKHMWIYAQAMVDLNCREIASGVREKVKVPLYKRWYRPLIGGIEQKFAHIHGPMFKVDKKKCINCGLCAKCCSQGNITLKNGKYKFGKKCVLCMGCSFNCPQNAIKVGIFKYWKVNGSYRVTELAKDKSIEFPYIKKGVKGIYKIYKKYYRECDKKLAAAGMNVFDYVEN